MADGIDQRKLTNCMICFSVWHQKECHTPPQTGTGNRHGWESCFGTEALNITQKRSCSEGGSQKNYCRLNFCKARSLFDLFQNFVCCSMCFVPNYPTDYFFARSDKYFLMQVMIKIIGFKMELMGVAATVVHINMSVTYLDTNRDDRKMIPDGIQHNTFDEVTTTS